MRAIEVAYLASVAAVLVGVAFTAHRLIAPAVALISAGGVALTGCREPPSSSCARGRPRRLHAPSHVLAYLAGVTTYIALPRDNLLDALIETVRFGLDT